jgi:hypothetical protein
MKNIHTITWDKIRYDIWHQADMNVAVNVQSYVARRVRDLTMDKVVFQVKIQIIDKLWESN